MQLRDEDTAEKLIDWMTDQAVILLTDPMVGEAVLDLTMTTNQLNSKSDVEASVEESLACGSDHDPILTSILGTRANKGRGGKGRYNLEKMDPEKFNAICVREAAGLIWNPAAEPGERCRTVNRLAEDIRDVLLQALEGSTTRSSGRGTGQRWWNKECGEAVAEHHSARRAWKRHKLANAVKKAKDGFYRNIITDLIEPKQLFQAVKWLKKRQRSNAPPP